MIDFVTNYIQEYMIDPIMGNDLFMGAFALSVIGFLVYQVRSMPSRMYRAFKLYSTKSIVIREDSDIFEQVLHDVTTNICFVKTPRHSQLKVDIIDKKKLRRDADISRFMCKLEGAYCMASLEVDDSRTGGSSGSGGIGSNDSPFNMMKKTWLIRLTVFGGESAIKRIVNRFEKFLVAKKKPKPYITVEYDQWNSGIKKMRRSDESLCFDGGIYTRIKSSCMEFIDSREEYLSKGFPWSFGILMHGEPGTGKSSIIHVLASELDRNISYINLADMNKDADLQRRMAEDHKKEIIVFEDIDCLFNQRDGDDAKITFSGLLNTLDGLCGGDDGRIIIMTTNHPDRLDPALIRAGRVDLNVEIPSKPSRETFTEYIARVYADDITNTEEFVNRVYDDCVSTAELLQKAREESLK